MTLFHPLVSEWFSQNVGTPTPIQENAWPKIQLKQDTLIAAPTGSGKTFAAFFVAINNLTEAALAGQLEKGTKVLYISPLKALSNDIEKNLQGPLRGIKQLAEDRGMPIPEVTAMVRSGDTPQSDRQAMIKNPPHILVTTPESLYLLLTSKNGRIMLQTVETIIVDEIHAMVGNKRGSHLSLSMERLTYLCNQTPVRIGLSATQKPIEKVGWFLTGMRSTDKYKENGSITLPPCHIVDAGHNREMDLALEIPKSELTALMANEVWTEVYERIMELVNSHKTTLIFVNTRRLAERLAHQLTERLGDEAVTAHHGSMSKDHRFDAEQRLKSGSLKTLVATASLELGIDIGAVDLVIQLGSPKSIAAFLQRVGRSGHSISGTPKGRLFPLSRDELVECTALLDAVRRKELDAIIMPEGPTDILAQQIVAECAARDYEEDELYEVMSKAFPYRNLTFDDFREVVVMLATGFTTRKGRRSAYLHHDGINRRIKPRKNARLTAIVAGGAIPDNFEFDVVLEPSNTFLGTLNEDFAIESLPGDIFQLGNNSWRILKVEAGKVRVADAEGQAPTIPFWFGESPGRTRELSESVSRLREEIGNRIDLDKIPLPEAEPSPENNAWKNPAISWLCDEVGIQPDAAEQVVNYLGATAAALEVMPTRKDIVLERFFDDAGDMHLVVHSPFGSRLNRAWGLSLRKKFCRRFNFELQAAATEDAIILSLGSTHSFPIMEVFNYLNPQTVRQVLVQALLDSPMFEIRWRWNASRALAILRRRAGYKVPPQIQRMQSEDLIALIFPDQLACLENIAGEREVPKHPLVDQTIHDCLTEAMDIEELEELLTLMQDKKIRLHAKDLREPSPLSSEIIVAKPYAFLDPAPGEERRTLAIKNRKFMDPSDAKEIGKLDVLAIKSVREEAFPNVASADELHDALSLHAYLTEAEVNENGWQLLIESLVEDIRVNSLSINNKNIWVCMERLDEFRHAFQEKCIEKFNHPLPEELKWNPDPEQKVDPYNEIIRGRMEMLPCITSEEIAETLGEKTSIIDQALLALENEGFIFRGTFTPDAGVEEWCERRLLARIHRYTLKKLRSEIEPVASGDFMRFLFSWHHLDEQVPEGPQSLNGILDQLEGFQAQAASWESDLLPSRLKNYDFQFLDYACLSGKVLWGRFSPPISHDEEKKISGPIKTTPISLVNRQQIGIWLSPLISSDLTDTYEKSVYEYLDQHGACFFDDIVRGTELFKVQVEDAIKGLVGKGLVTSDSFTGLRALLVPTKYKTSQRGRRHTSPAFGMDHAGRWSLIKNIENPSAKAGLDKSNGITYDKQLQQMANIFLKRYGVVFRKIYDRESLTVPWRDLVRVLRRMEARGEIRGGRFVLGVYGEQFATTEALTMLRKTRKLPKTGNLIAISASDPLNLVGIITPGGKIPAIYSNRILFKDGEPIMTKVGKEINLIQKQPQDQMHGLERRLIERDISPHLRKYLGKGIY